MFDRATGSALDLFRTRRVASAAQRIMLIARDGGCTKPGCPVGAYGCQVHHVTQDWAQGGLTNIDDLGLACPPDNRAVAPGGWTTSMSPRHDVEWTPPPNLDTGQTRINTHHTPERLLRPEDDGEEVRNSADAQANRVGDAEACPQPSTGDASEPGGPAPPDNEAA